jgi:hypothetical protein
VNDLEERLRDAYRSVAGTVTPQSVPEPRLKARAARSSRMRLLAPVAAAAGVAAVVLTALLVASHSPVTRPATHRHHHGTASAIPPFTVVSQGSALQVYRTGTNRLTATLSPPDGLQFANVASDGTAGGFLAAAEDGASSGNGCQAAFYRFTLSPDGHPSKLTLLRWAHGDLPTALAASPGGATIAYSAVHCATGNGTTNAPQTTPIGVIGTLTARGDRTWTYDIGQDTPSYLSVSASGGTLAFPMYTGFSANPVQSLYLLNTASAAKTVSGASRILYNIHPDSVTISPDGTTLYISLGGQIRSYDAATGKQIAVLGHTGGKCGTSLDETGRFLLTQCSGNGVGGTITGYDLKTGKTIPLPYSTNVTEAGNATAW